MTATIDNLIIDGNHLAHRCRHVFSLSSRGVDVSVTYGFLSVMKSMLRKFKPTSVIVCWDGGVPNHRREAIPEYKANRDHGDPFEYEEFVRQVTELDTYALRIMGCVTARRRLAEADDLMYHASRILVGNCVIATGDQDLLQAIGDGVSVYNPTKDIIYDAKRVKEEFGIDISKFVDWRSLQGDSSDNIAGVTGIGSKTATKLFNQFGTLTGIMNAALGNNPAGVITGKLGDNIRLFGWPRVTKNIYVMALYADRVGARKAVIDACNNHVPCSVGAVKRYLLSNQFISLVDGTFLGPISKLQKPKIRTKGVRIPIVAVTRKPV